MKFLKKILTKFPNRNFSSQKNAGFTLMELLVVIAIMVIVTAVVIYNYSQFNSTTLVTNYAYEVAFAIREAQIYGLSVLGNGETFQIGYGVHFDSDSTTIGGASFSLFADLALSSGSPVGNRRFDFASCPVPYSPATCGEFVKKNTFVGSYKVDTFCVVKDTTTECNKVIPGSSQQTISTLDITFLRPNPDAYIIADAGVDGPADPQNSQSPNSRAEITIVSPHGEKKKVVVYSTGQISIQAVPTPAS